MATDLKELQAFAVNFLQQQLQDPEIPNQAKVEIALELLKLSTTKAEVDINSQITSGPESLEQSTQNLSIPELYRLSESWQMWLVENKLRGVADEGLVEILQGQGLTAEAANQVVFALPQEVSFAFLEPKWRSLQHRQLIAEVYRDKEKSAQGSIDLWSTLSGTEFRQYYWRTHRPVLLTQLGGDRPWHTTASFSEKFGGHGITATAFPQVSASPLANENPDLVITTLKEYFAKSEPQVYVNFDVLDLGVEAIANFYHSYPMLKEYLDCDVPDYGQADLWLQSTVSPFTLQAKLEDHWIMQLWGKTQWHIAAPWHSEFLYGNEDWLSSLDLEDYNLDRYPLLAQANFYQLTLQAGQALYLPALWWHQCRATENSAQVHLQNLRT